MTTHDSKPPAPGSTARMRRTDQHGTRLPLAGETVQIVRAAPLADAPGYLVCKAGQPAHTALVRAEWIAEVLEHATPARARLRGIAPHPQEEPMPTFAPDPTPAPELDLSGLDPIARGQALSAAIAANGWTQREAGQRAGLSQSRVSTYLRALALPGYLRAQVASGELSVAEAFRNARTIEEAGEAEPPATEEARLAALNRIEAGRRFEARWKDRWHEIARRLQGELKRGRLEVEGREAEIKELRQRIEQLTRGGKELHRLADSATVLAAKAAQEAAQRLERLELAEETIRQLVGEREQIGRPLVRHEAAPPALTIHIENVYLR